MEFGKLADITNMALTLPPDFGGFIEPVPVDQLEVYLGCTGWSMPQWKGKWYAPKSKPNTFLEQYATLFNSIEMNSTFYSTPRDAILERWNQQTPEDFRFCAKIAQHISRKHAIDAKIDAFHQQLQHLSLLGAKMNTFFMQLPQTFSPEYSQPLFRFLEEVPDSVQLAVEFRHPDWFEPSLWEETCMGLTSLGIGTVITDVAGRRDVLHMSFTSDFTVIRFVGNGMHNSDFSRCDDWIARLETWRKAGLKEVYFLHHQPDNILAPDMAIYFYKKLKEKYTFKGRCADKAPYADKQISLF